VAKVLVDTETILDQYKKKIGDIGKNLESTKRYRDELNFKVDNLQKTIEGISVVCDSNHSSLGSNLEKIASRFAEKTVDLESANEGY